MTQVWPVSSVWPPSVGGGGGGSLLEIPDSGVLYDDIVTLQSTPGSAGGARAVLLINDTDWRYDDTLLRWISPVAYELSLAAGGFALEARISGTADPVAAEGWTNVGDPPVYNVRGRIKLLNFVGATSAHSVDAGGTVYGPVTEANEETALASLQTLIEAGESGSSCTIWGTGAEARMVVAAVDSLVASTNTVVLGDGLPSLWCGDAAHNQSYVRRTGWNWTATGAVTIHCGWIGVAETWTGSGAAAAVIQAYPGTSSPIALGVANEPAGLQWRAVVSSFKYGVHEWAPITPGQPEWIEWVTTVGCDIDGGTYDTVAAIIMRNGKLCANLATAGTCVTTDWTYVGVVGGDIESFYRDITFGWVNR